MATAKVINEGTLGDRLLDMFEQSVIIQSLVTFLLIASCCTIWIHGQLSGNAVDMPQDLVNLTLLVVGFWFGQKTNYNAKSTVESVSRNITAAAIAAGGQNDGNGRVAPTGDSATTCP